MGAVEAAASLPWARSRRRVDLSNHRDDVVVASDGAALERVLARLLVELGTLHVKQL